MAKFNFELYRQPFETGEHWELKREFMEKYQNDFSEDRLLCLAQAYSNIELLHCSYPGPVMQQIHELSKSLYGCKKFRERINKNSNKEEKTPTMQSLGEKRKLCYEEDFRKPVKLIKFCNSKDSVFPKPPCSISETVNVGENCKSPALGIWEKSDVPMHNNPPNLMLKIPQDKCQKIECDIVCQETAMFFPEKITPVNNNPRISDHENLSSLSVIPDEDKNENFGYEVASNFKGKCDLSGTLDSDKLRLMQDLSEEIRKQLANKKIPFTAIQCAAQSLKITNAIQFNIYPDSKSPPHSRLYCCDFYLKRLLISSGKDCSKKKARLRAAESAVDNLLNPFKWMMQQSDLGQNHNTTSDLKCTDSDVPVEVELNYSEKVGVKYQEPASLNVNNTPVLRKAEVFRYPKRHVFILNERLLYSSLQKLFVLLDNREMKPVCQRTHAAVLSDSASFSQKVFQYKLSDIPATSTQPVSIRADVLLDGEILSTAVAQKKADAKREAASSAVEMLRKLVYVIKVKGESLEGFIINRDEMMNFTSNTLLENNIGCKMMKMMGWTGGGIGKNSGITEPIVAKEHRFGRGLGYNDDSSNLSSLRPKIESLLRDYQNSNTTDDLIFSTDFTKPERKEIHRLASNYNLHSSSHGKGSGRQLVLRHKYTVPELLNILVNAGGSTKKYELLDLSNMEDSF